LRFFSSWLISFFLLLIDVVDRQYCRTCQRRPQRWASSGRWMAGMLFVVVVVQEFDDITCRYRGSPVTSSWLVCIAIFRHRRLSSRPRFCMVLSISWFVVVRVRSWRNPRAISACLHCRLSVSWLPLSLIIRVKVLRCKRSLPSSMGMVFIFTMTCKMWMITNLINNTVKLCYDR